METIVNQQKTLRVAQIGCGSISAYTMQYVFDKGGLIVCAYDNNASKIGKSIGTVLKNNIAIVKTGDDVMIEDIKNLERSLNEHKPDIAIITTFGPFVDIYEAMLTCAKCGVNAISACDEAFFPMNSNPQLVKNLSKVAKENECTVTSISNQDSAWGGMISVICGATQTIKKIKGKTTYNIEDYGKIIADAHGVGLTLKEFDEKIAFINKVSDMERARLISTGIYAPQYMWPANNWICDKLGLTIATQIQRCIPQVSKTTIRSSALGKIIPKGLVTGMKVIVTTKTIEGIVVETENTGKVYSKEDVDKNEWSIEGEPDTTLAINKSQIKEMTCATVVNRLIDVINAPSGYVSSDKLPDITYKFHI